MGLRGIFACAFIVSTGLLTGMAALPSGAAASEPYSAAAIDPSQQESGLFSRIKRKACQVSLAARLTDRKGNRDRSRNCDE